jgi:hypothetical protein
MKITEILLENKKGVKAPVKPRNFVAKNQQTSGSGAHRDKKKEQKQGYEKHKSKSVAEGGREMTNTPRDKFISRMSPSVDNNALMQKVAKVVNSPEFNEDTILKIVDAGNTVTHPVGRYIQKEFDELQYDLGRQYEDYPERVAEKLLSMLIARTKQGVAEGFNNEIDMELHRIAQSEDEEMLVDAMHGLLGTGVSDTLEDMINELADELAAKGMTELLNDEDKMIELLMDKVTKEYGDPDIAEGLKDPKDNPCWKGYKPVGTKKKNGKTVPNCVPKE